MKKCYLSEVACQIAAHQILTHAYYHLKSYDPAAQLLLKVRSELTNTMSVNTYVLCLGIELILEDNGTIFTGGIEVLA